MANKILIADDEPDILEILQYNLRAEGYEVFTAKNGNEAFEVAKINNPQLIILDIMMPEKSGIEACAILRAMPMFRKTFIIFLTALSDEVTEIKGLETGADDFIAKPVSPRVFMSKVNAFFRRLEHSGLGKIQINQLEIDRESFVVRYENNEVILARKEFELLALLASKPGKVFLRNEILGHVWGADVIVGDRTIDVHIRKVRQKLGIDCITTVKGVGYKFEWI
ncbi:MAG TPA: response regulator transcription factor [Ferruginibacter sp.]|nr:response regulator transcription factor [Ferruginibacter sp.]